MKGKFRLVATLGALLLPMAISSVPLAAADEAPRRDWIIGPFKPPPRWERQQQDRPSYPQLLAWASLTQDSERSVMTLVAKRLTPGTSVESFANKNGGAKTFPGMKTPRTQIQTIEGWSGHRVQLDGILEGPVQRMVRQLFFVNGTVGYVVTLVAPQSQAAARERDLEDTVSGLVPVPPLHPQDPPVPDMRSH